MPAAALSVSASAILLHMFRGAVIAPSDIGPPLVITAGTESVTGGALKKVGAPALIATATVGPNVAAELHVNFGASAGASRNAQIRLRGGIAAGNFYQLLLQPVGFLQLLRADAFAPTVLWNTGVGAISGDYWIRLVANGSLLEVLTSTDGLYFESQAIVEDATYLNQTEMAIVLTDNDANPTIQAPNLRVWRGAGATISGAPHVYNLVIDGTNYVVHTAQQPWSLASNSPANTLQRFELREADDAVLAVDGALKNRSEVVAQEYSEWGVPYWQSFSIKVDSGDTNTADWVILGQWHAAEDVGDAGLPPVLDWEVDGTTYKVVSRSSTEDPTITDQPPVTRWSATLVRDVWINWVVRVVFSHTAGASLEVWKDGVKVVESLSTTIGYNDVLPPYLRFGVYKERTPETWIVHYANMEVGTADLSDRITSPLAIPGGP